MSGTGPETIVQRHWSGTGRLKRIEEALRAAGKDPKNLACADLYPYDQMHGRGVVATAELAGHAALEPGLRVLDLGCGIGGASRYLANEHKCAVTGLDLTPDFIAAARALTAQCGLGGKIEFIEGNAIDLPFKDGSFDRVWCHNVTMNIADKARFAAEVARVLVRGGRFVLAEAALGPAGSPIFPLPWADDPSSSFLARPAEMRAILERAGFKIVAQLDVTARALAFPEEMRARAARGEPPLVLSHMVNGEDYLARGRNSQKSLGEGRIVDHIIVAEKA
jgi:SAM-dependent methyltransferase